MKTFSVKEVAEVLSMTPRGVIQRLNRGQLKGNKKLNQFGVPEWQIYANREILMAMEAKKFSSSPINEQSFAPDVDDTIDAEDIEVGEFNAEPSNWRDIELARLEVLAEKLVKPLAERLEAQAAELREKERQLEEKDRQLRLLPDLEKRAEAERKTAELKELETIALQKQVSELQLKAVQEAEVLRQQIVALEQEKEKKEAEANEATRVAEELKLQSGELEQKLAAEAEEKQKVDEQLLAMKAQLEVLTAKVERSWWKKFFGVE